jgi:flagellar M-ring protein FliF
MADPKDVIANLARSGRMQIAAGLAVTALVGGALGVIVLRGDQGGESLLFSGLDLQEAADIVDRLETANIRYKLEGGGSAIFVDRAKVDDARMMLSEQGLPTRGSVGWEIFDKTDTFGTTSFVQNINKVRALEGELSRTISSLDMVKAARVHLVLPEHTLFQTDAATPSASVILSLTGNTMDSEKVRAIRNLVASAVPALTMNRITIIDDQGRTLAAGAEDDEKSGMSGGAADERRGALEASYQKKVAEIVENIAGPGAARVQVSIDADFNRVTQTSEDFDPDRRVVRASSTRENSSNSTDREPGDTTTVANNVPTGAPADANPQQPSSQSTETSSEETVNYEISRTSRTEIIEGPKITRLSVAVAVDHQMIPGVDGAPPTFQPRTPEELTRILSLVRSAVGFNEARGDVVTVENIPFARPDLNVGEGVAPGPFDFDKFDAVRAGEIAALLITSLALVFFVLRPLARGLFTKSDGSENTGSLPSPGGRNRSIGSDARGGQDASGGSADLALARQDQGHGNIDIPMQERLDAGIDVARITGQVKASSIKKMSEVVSSHPEESMSIIRGWLAEESAR